MFIFPRLAYAGARGATHYWTICVRLIAAGAYVPMTEAMLHRPDPLCDAEGIKAEITVESLQRSGKVRNVTPTYVSAGKNLGKKNATNCLTQAIQEARSRYNKQHKRGDIATPDAVDAADADAAAADAADDADAAAADAGAPDGVVARELRPPPMLVKKLGESRERAHCRCQRAGGIVRSGHGPRVRHSLFFLVKGRPGLRPRAGSGI